MSSFTHYIVSLVCEVMRTKDMKKGLISDFKVAHKAKFTVEVSSTTNTRLNVCRNNSEMSPYNQLTVRCMLCLHFNVCKLSG